MNAVITITAQMIKTAERAGAYARRVRAYEAEGMTTSDAQGVYEAELMRDARELFEDVVEATRDFMAAGYNGLAYAAEAWSELGFGSAAIDLARATLEEVAR